MALAPFHLPASSENSSSIGNGSLSAGDNVSELCSWDFEGLRQKSAGISTARPTVMVGLHGDWSD